MSAPIVIYQMGKVGSSALYEMLGKNKSVQRPTYHVHTLRDDGIGRHIINNVDWQDKLHIGDSIKVRRLLANSDLSGQVPPEKKWKWVSPVREPIARNLSAFFQHHDSYIPDMIGRWERGELTVMDIRNTFIQRYDHTIPLRWFDDEYKALFKLNVYEVPFDKDEGYLVMQTGVFDILLIRSEDMSTFPIALFEEFFEEKGLEVKQVLVGEKRPYADVYKAFKAEARFPKQFVDALYDSPYMRTFYSTEQIDEFKQKYID